MIVFVTTRAHGYTVAALRDGTFGAKLPEIGWMAWEDVVQAMTLPVATYIFCDIDRLMPAQLDAAALVYRRAVAAGLRCLNDPARVKQRYGLLYALHAAGRNPFAVYRAEALPRPARFPVFVRHEYEHGEPVTGLLADQAALEDALERLQADGTSLRYLIVIEFCAAPVAPGVWRKLGSFRIGAAMHVDHAVVEDRWLVKHGTAGLSSPEMFARECAEVTANDCPAAVAAAFEVAGLEYGRADHATVDGWEVVYEINSNPHFEPLTTQRSAVRDAAMAVARRRFAALLAAVDTVAVGQVVLVAQAGIARRGLRFVARVISRWRGRR